LRWLVLIWYRIKCFSTFVQLMQIQRKCVILNLFRIERDLWKRWNVFYRQFFKFNFLPFKCQEFTFTNYEKSIVKSHDVPIGWLYELTFIIKLVRVPYYLIIFCLDFLALLEKDDFRCPSVYYDKPNIFLLDSFLI
jgi:hypothetical protein